MRGFGGQGFVDISLLLQDLGALGCPGFFSCCAVLDAVCDFHHDGGVWESKDVAISATSEVLCPAEGIESLLCVEFRGILKPLMLHELKERGLCSSFLAQIVFGCGWWLAWKLGRQFIPSLCHNMRHHDAWSVA